MYSIETHTFTYKTHIRLTHLCRQSDKYTAKTVGFRLACAPKSSEILIIIYHATILLCAFAENHTYIVGLLPAIQRTCIHICIKWWCPFKFKITLKVAYMICCWYMAYRHTLTKPSICGKIAINFNKYWLVSCSKWCVGYWPIASHSNHFSSSCLCTFHVNEVNE